MMAILTSISWELYVLSAYGLVNIVVLGRCITRVSKQKGKLSNQRRRIHDLEDDVRSLYESGTTLGEKLHSLEKSYRVLKEQQEKLTLKEPSQQTYRNAIKAIHNGEPLNQVADASGLSRGEVELLTLLQKINEKGEPDKKTSPVDAEY